MENLELLWQYQLAELELEKFEKKLKDTPTRKKMVKLHRFLQTSQSRIQEIEKLAIVRKNNISELETQNKALVADIEDLNKDISYYSECDVEELSEKEVQDLVKNCEQVYDNIVGIKKQLTHLKQELDKTDKEIREIYIKMKAAKTEYDALKAEHAKEIASGQTERAALKTRIDQAAQKVPADLMEEYRRIKGFRQNPVALLENDRCSGCRMQLPSGVASQVTSSKKPVECENCGRILIVL